MKHRFNALIIIVGLMLFLTWQWVGWAEATAAPQVATVGRNGAACAYATIDSALDDAADGDTIFIAPGTYNESLGSLGLDLHLTAATADCTMAAPQADPADYTINGTMFAAEGGVVRIAAGHIVTFTRLTLQNGQATQGGVLYVAGGGTAVLERSHVRQGVATENGGLIYVAAEGHLVANQAFLEGGSAQTGGGLYLLGEAELHYTDLWGSSATLGGGAAVTGEGHLVWLIGSVGNQSNPNTASKDGGGIHLTSFATVELGNISIRDNEAGRDGGGIYAQGPQVSITLLDTRISLNSAADNGGGLYIADGVSLLLDEMGFIAANTADYGAGIYADGVMVHLQGDSRVQHNIAAHAGGGVYLVGGSQLHMAGGLIRHNRATTSLGGGVLVAEGKAFLENVTIQQNEAVFGGGLAQLGFAGNSVAITNSQVISNTAAQHGGGLFTANRSLIWVDTNGQSQLLGNHAGVNGGAAYQTGASGQLILLADPEVMGSSLLVAHNSANSNGGAFYSEDGNLGLVGNVLLTHNAAVGDGGAVYQTGGNLSLGNIEQKHLFIEHNEAVTGRGGGLYLSNVGAALGLLINTTIRHNVADNGGGGVYVGNNSKIQLSNAHIHHNQAQDGAGLFVSLSQVYIVQDGEYCANAQLPANHYCSELRGNVATGEGGAVRVEFASQVLIQQTAVVSNTATAAGGLMNDGLATLQIRNSLFTHNSDKALRVDNNATLELYQTTFTANDWAIDINSPAATVSQNNNIVWGNGFGVESAVPLGIGCSLSQNFVWGAMVNPQFQTTLRGDYRLGVGSLAIDRCGSGAEVDLDGVPRPQGASYDAGAFESGRPLILFPATIEIPEGDAGLTPLPFVITFSEPTQNEVELVVATFSQTALSGVDFVPFTQTIAIPTGTISHTILLEMVGDEVYEGDEQFVVELSEAVGAELTAETTLITIVDDDSVSITVANGSAVEGNEGTTPLLFAVNLSNPSAFTITLDFATGTELDTAEDDVDYVNTSGIFTLAPGQTAAMIPIRVIGDEEEEENEIFTLTLSNPQGATLVNTLAIGTIVDDDGAKVIFLPFISR